MKALDIPELLTQADQLCAAATPGPWEPIDDYDGCDGNTPHGWRGMCCHRSHGGHGGSGLLFATHEWDVGLKEDDAAFIAFARTALPTLVEEVRRLQIKLYQANGYISMLTGIPIERPS